MSEERDALPLIDARATRDAAWGLVREDTTYLREGLSARSIGQRVKDRALDEIADTVDTAREIASENKAVIAGTGLALAAWFLRMPLINGIKIAAQRLKDLRD